MSIRRALLFSCFLIGVLLLASCGGTPGGAGDSGEPEIEPSPPVARDGVLEAVTWNLKLYNNRGATKARNVNRVLDSLKADLYAFQEITDRASLDELARRHDGYRGFVARHIPYNQKTAFLFNSNAIDSLDSGVLDGDEGQSPGDWQNRLPLFFEFNYRYNDAGDTRRVYAVVIHAKAQTDSTSSSSYEQRRRSAESLYDFLKNRRPDALVLLLGDYNDDVDVSIYGGKPTPYRPFVEDSAAFRVLSGRLSEEGRPSTVRYEDMVDHITVSDELLPYYRDGSVAVYRKPEQYIPSYVNTTSDHYPVWAQFDMRTPQDQAVTSVR